MSPLLVSVPPALPRSTPIAPSPPDASIDPLFSTPELMFNISSGVENSGSILASGGDGAIGVDLGNAGGTLTNSGDITAEAASTSTYYAVGVLTRDFATIANSGT